MKELAKVHLLHKLRFLERIIMSAIHFLKVYWKNPHHVFRHWLLMVALPLIFLTPTHSYANPVALTLLVDGVVKTAKFAGAAASLASIFGGFSGQSDDHPLYSLGDNSPTLSISATETTFNLLLKQPNDVSEFEDDLPAVLSGIAKINTPTGAVDAWSFSVSVEADNATLISPLKTELDVQGFVQHIIVPHPELMEKTPAPALNYDLGISVPCLGFPCSYATSTLLDSDSDNNTHNNGHHIDLLRTNLEVRCCSTQVGNIDYFNVVLEAKHVIPEPSTVSSLWAVFLALACVRRRHSKKESATVRSSFPHD